jgi:MFS family permease
MAPIRLVPVPDQSKGREGLERVVGALRPMFSPGRSNAGGQRIALAALTIACIGVFLTALDQTVVVTALPQIITDLQIPITQLDHAAWIISAYLLGFVVAMPLMGRVSDIYGRRRIFLLCLAIFGSGSLLCGLAPMLGQAIDLSFLSALHIDTTSPGLIWLIAARLFQAVGGGAVVPVAMAIAGDFYGQERRGLALGIIGAVTEAGGVLGPLYGALVVQHLGWQCIFYFNVPFVIALGACAWIFIPRSTRLREGIDWIGAILLGLALTCLSLGLAQQGTDLGPPMPNAPAPQNNPVALVLALIFFIAFVLVERRTRWPVIEIALFKRFPFSATSLVSLFVGAALIIAMADIPIFVDTVLQLPVLDSGLALLHLTVMIPVGALLGGWLCGRISCRLTGVLGLLFTAAGFFLMSRWPIHVDWNQITISTTTAGLGFGLVIAPIGTTAINAVRANQAGMGSAIATALRMVGMILGLAALTSWALAYFKRLAANYPSLPTTATAAQFAQWSKGYAAHLVQSAHTVYSAVFFTSMILCLVAIIPAIFLWGRQAPVEDDAASSVTEPASPTAITLPGVAIEDTPTRPVVSVEQQEPGEPPADGNTDKRKWKWWRNAKWWRDRKRRRKILAIGSIALILLLIGGGIFAAFMSQPGTSSGIGPGSATGSTNGADTATPVAGPRMIQLALDKSALTSIFASQLNVQSGALSNLSATPVPGDGLVLSLNLHIDMNGLHRMIPVELDCIISVDPQHDLQLRLLRLKRDGLDAGSAAAAKMQTALNQLLAAAVMPALRHQLRSAKLISAHTSNSIVCGKGMEMLALLIQAPPIQGIAAQPTPTTFCLSGPIQNIGKMMGG